LFHIIAYRLSLNAGTDAMSISRLAQWRRSLFALFPERHLYIRSGGEMRGLVLTTHKQLAAAAVVAFSFLWMGVATAALLIHVIAPSSSDQRIMALQARYERVIADRDARLISYDTSRGSTADLARSVEHQQAALAMLLNQMRGGQPLALTTPARPGASPMARIEAVREDQDRLITAAQAVASNRAERLRQTLRLAGLDPSAYSHSAGDRGGPLITAGDPRALAAVLDVDPAFAARIQQAASNMSEMRNLSAAEVSLPLRRPTVNGQTHETSGFGVRADPFSGESAFHSGLDFAGPMNTPVYATAPGVVSFTGPRSGYGNVVEIDHGNGFKTRFGHLHTIAVAVGQRVAIGSRIGGIGSTGRSTGPHLHYEVWVNGRAQNPLRFLRAGDYVQQAN
jgi:murein DD-endopeptidase MepM/ murein hydrolase activator NlpD